jgi:sensor domain CHASE-containing protein
MSACRRAIWRNGSEGYINPKTSKAVVVALVLASTLLGIMILLNVALLIWTQRQRQKQIREDQVVEEQEKVGMAWKDN